jgi:type I restriction enzyme M protein
MEKGQLMGDCVTKEIVAKLWSLCNILRDDGITYNEYVTELTYLLFLKMMAETGRESALPDGYRWGELDKREGLDQLDYYRRLLLDLGSHGRGQMAAIFADAQTKRAQMGPNLAGLMSVAEARSMDRIVAFMAIAPQLTNSNFHGIIPLYS